MLNVFFIFDLILNFFTSYKNRDGDWEKSNKKIALRYLRHNFFVDFLISIPFDWIMELFSNSSISRNYNKFFRIFKLPKLFSTFKMSKYFSLSWILKSIHFADNLRYEIKAKQNYIKILGIVIILYLALHVYSCIFIAIGRSNT